MGITITTTKPKYTFDMGYGGFRNLRTNIALAINKEFGKNYAAIVYCNSKESYEENDRIANELIKKYNLSKYDDILDFLYSSDCDGKISYKTCKHIYDLIKDIDYEDQYFRYAIMAHNDYNEFKEFLIDCYSNHKNMIYF